VSATPATALLEIEDALAIVLDSALPLPGQDVALAAADGRFLAAPVLAAIELPPFTSSAMDGYAVRAADTPGMLTVVGESAAGSPYDGTLALGQAVEISTGAVLPDGADAIVPIEEATAAAGVDRITVPGADAEQFVRRAGSDSAQGAQILAAGIRLGPAQIGAAAAVGLGSLLCTHVPSVAIFATGSELRQAGERLAPGEIYDSSGPLLTAALHRVGVTVTRIPAAIDTPQAHREALSEALTHDVVISSGGVSVGRHDLVRVIGAELGVRELIWRIKLRPGKPMTFGIRNRTLVFGLPGNPVSTLVCFELFVRPALLALQGAANPGPAFQTAVLASALRRYAERDDLIRVWRDARGRLTPVGGQQSHQIAFTAQADGLARIPAGTGELLAGSEVAYLPLDPA
jgi:molybdopterin molybdotransferase